MTELTCYKMMMDQFIRCFTGKEEIPEWNNIYTEYIGLRENKGTKFVVALMSEIKALEAKKKIIDILIRVLANAEIMNSCSSSEIQKLASELRQEGCKGKFDYSDKEEFSKDLRSANSYSKKFTTQITSKRKELDEYYAKHGENSKSEKDFEILAVTLTDHFKVHIDYSAITVARFCVMMNQYEQYCEVRHAENNNILNGRKR